MTNNEEIKEEWCGKWWGIISKDNPITWNNSRNYPNPNEKRNQPKTKHIEQGENFIIKQLRAIREKSKEDHLNREREIRRINEKKIESEKSKIQPTKKSESVTVIPKKVPITSNNPLDEKTIMRDYDVEFYMKRGLSQMEAIEYIKNKLKVKMLWSKMSTRN